MLYFLTYMYQSDRQNKMLLEWRLSRVLKVSLLIHFLKFKIWALQRNDQSEHSDLFWLEKYEPEKWLAIALAYRSFDM